MSEIKQCRKFAHRKPLKKGDPLRKRITLARLHLLQKHPFFGYISLYLNPVEANEEVPTIAVSADRTLLINRKFLEEQPDCDLPAFLAHETMHLVTECFSRRPKKANPEAWNMANDFAINYLIFNPEHGAGMPIPQKTIPLYDVPEYWGKCTEYIYHDLMSNAQKMKSLEDKWHDDSACRCAGTTEEQQEEIKNMINGAASVARDAGNLPGALEKFVYQINAPQTDWRRELASLIMENCRRRYTWKKPNRRTMLSGIITPGHAPSIPSVVCGMDTSGSMSDEDRVDAISEINGILSVSEGVGTLGLFDCQLYYWGEVTKDSIQSLPLQRGGTDFHDFFKKADELEEKPACVILFSDLCGPFPTTKPNYPVIFVRPKGINQEPPWGGCRIIDFEIKK